MLLVTGSVPRPTGGPGRGRVCHDYYERTFRECAVSHVFFLTLCHGEWRIEKCYVPGLFLKLEKQTRNVSRTVSESHYFLRISVFEYLHISQQRLT